MTDKPRYRKATEVVQVGGHRRMLGTRRPDSNCYGLLEKISRLIVFPFLAIKFAQVVEADCVLGIVGAQRFPRDIGCPRQKRLCNRVLAIEVVGDGEIGQNRNHLLAVSTAGFAQ